MRHIFRLIFIVMVAISPTYGAEISDVRTAVLRHVIPNPIPMIQSSQRADYFTPFVQHREFSNDLDTYIDCYPMSTEGVILLLSDARDDIVNDPAFSVASAAVLNAVAYRVFSFCSAPPEVNEPRREVVVPGLVNLVRDLCLRVVDERDATAREILLLGINGCTSSLIAIEGGGAALAQLREPMWTIYALKNKSDFENRLLLDTFALFYWAPPG